MDLVIDTTTLVDASGQGMDEHAKSSFDLLQKLNGMEGWRLCLDSKRKIEREYDLRISDQMFARKWMQRHGERRFWPPDCRLPKGVRVKLKEIHFDWDDLPFVETAFASETKYLVTREFNSYTLKVRQTLWRDLKVRVYTAQQILEILSEPQ
jgi:hypothetical protein